MENPRKPVSVAIIAMRLHRRESQINLDRMNNHDGKVQWAESRMRSAMLTSSRLTTGDIA